MKNLQTEWTRLLLGSLAGAGIRDVVVSPGSRSTPFVLSAARHPELRLFDVIDERAAAFFALGQARVSGRPTLLICTSGTAGANYLPAVIEAEMSSTPLLVLTADRPVDLVGCGANQTIDQAKLYGDHVRRCFDLGEANADPRAFRALRRAAVQAVTATLHPEPGPVHLNARARKPLEPQEAKNEDEARLREDVDVLLERPPAVSVPRLVPRRSEIDALAELCRRTERGLIVAGPAPLAQGGAADAVFDLARRTGFPLLADATSQLRYRAAIPEDVVNVGALGVILGSAEFRRKHRPELILQIGRAPTTGVWETYLAENAGVELWLLGPHGWNDPQSTATHRLIADTDATARELTECLAPRTCPPQGIQGGKGQSETAWGRAFREAEATVQRLIDEELDASGLSEGAVAREVVQALPDDALLVVGNSLPIRELDLYGTSLPKKIAVASQRGASGIDGVTSGAVGAAVAAGRPTALLVGDVSFLHDLSGLGAARHVTTPFALVVVQNRGGRIFEMLPVASHPAVEDEAFDHWLTSHDHDFSHAAALFGLDFARADSREALRTALAAALGKPGVTVIEAVVPPSGAVEQNRRVASAWGSP